MGWSESTSFRGWVKVSVPLYSLHFIPVPDLEDSRLHILNIFVSHFQFDRYCGRGHVCLCPFIWFLYAKVFLIINVHIRSLHKATSHFFSSPPPAVNGTLLCMWSWGRAWADVAPSCPFPTVFYWHGTFRQTLWWWWKTQERSGHSLASWKFLKRSSNFSTSCFGRHFENVRAICPLEGW